MADWNLPDLTTLKSDILDILRERSEAAAKMDPTDQTNLPVGWIAWSSGNRRFEIWDGSAFVALSTTLNMSADQLGGQPSAYYRNASNLNAGTVPVARLPSATTGVAGAVQLNSSTTSTSTTQAATPSAVKAVRDIADSKAPATHTHEASDISGGAGFDPDEAYTFTAIQTFNQRVRIDDATQLEFADPGVSTHMRVRHDGSTGYIDLFKSGGLRIQDSNTTRFLFQNDGSFHAQGTVTANSVVLSSDPALKEDMRPFDDPLSILSGMEGYTYRWKASGKDAAGVNSKEVGRVLPCAVSRSKSLHDGKEYDSVDYNALVGLLVAAVNSLASRVAELENASLS